MSTKNLARDVESIALALSEEGGYEYYHIDDDLRELAKDVSDMQAENAKLREDLEFERSENGWAREFLNRMGQKCGTKDCPSLVAYVTKLEAENAKLRELVSDVHMEYVGTLNECESLNEGLIYEYSGSVEADVAKSRAKFKADRHRFDAALRELGVEVDG